MNKLLVILLAAVLLVSCNCDTSDCDKIDKNPLSENEHLVLATAWFQKSAEMRACFYQAYNLAELKLAQHKTNYKGTKPTAVVLDIDETVLDNSPFEVFLIENGGAYNSDNWKAWCEKGAAEVLPGALEFTNFAKELGVEVYYISNRKNDVLDITIQNLKDKGFPNASAEFVMLRELGESGDKTKRRAKVQETHEILLFVGDNLTDQDQKYAHRGKDLGFEITDKNQAEFGDKLIILPNPMYGEWENALYGNDYKKAADEKTKLRKTALKGF